jgi:hypothetical protein
MFLEPEASGKRYPKNTVLAPHVTEDSRNGSIRYFQKDVDEVVGITRPQKRDQVDTAIDSQHISKVALSEAMTGSNPTDRGKLGTKRHILTVRKCIPLSVVISSANSHDTKLVSNAIDNRLSSDLLLFQHKAMMKR